MNVLSHNRFLILVAAVLGSQAALAQYQIVEIIGDPGTLPPPASLISDPFYDAPSINNSGELVFQASAFVSVGSGPVIDAGAFWSNGNPLGMIVEPLYLLSGPGDPTCQALIPLAERSVRCRGTEVGQPLVNDNGVLAMKHGRTLSSIGDDAGTEYVTFDTAGLPSTPTMPGVIDPTIVAQYGVDDGNGRTYDFRDKMAAGDFNNVGTGQLVYRTKGTCEPGGRYIGNAYLKSDGPVAMAAFGDPSPNSPPGFLLFTDCDADVGAIGARFAVQPNGAIGVFSGRITQGSQTLDGLYYTDINAPAPVLVDELPLGSSGGALLAVDINDNGRVVYSGTDCDGVAGADICVKQYDSTAAPNVLSNVFTADVAVAANGMIAFHGTYNGDTGLFLWDGVQGNAPTAVLVNGDLYIDGRPITGIRWQSMGFNDSLQFAAVLNFDVANPRDNALVKLVQLGEPLISITDPTPPVNNNNIDFGPIDVGSTAQGTLTITNIGTGPLNIGVIGDTDALNAPFSIVADNCSNTTLQDSSEDCEIEILFAPTNNVFSVDTFNIPSNTPSTPNLTFSVNGAGQLLPEPDITVTDDIDPADDLSLPFGSLESGLTNTATVTISNTGSAVLQLGQVAGLDTLSPPFAITSDTCSAQIIVVGGDCNLTVDFQPSQAITSNDSFDIPSDDPDEPSLTVQLSGTGFLPDRGVLRVSETAVTVTEAAGATVAVTILRENGSSGDVGVDYTLVNGTALAGEDFVADSNTIPFGDGVTSAMFDVQILDDTNFEPNESFTVELLNETGGVAIGTDSVLAVTIIDDDAPDVFDVGVAISADKDTIAGSGDNFITYTIDVVNNGPDTATGVEVSVNWDVDLTVSGTPGCDIGSQCFEDGMGALTNTWMIGDIPPGGTGSAIVMTEAIPDTGCLTSEVTIIADAGDSDAQNDTAQVLSGSGDCADVFIQTEYWSGDILIDDLDKSVLIKLDLNVENIGPDPVASFIVRLVLDGFIPKLHDPGCTWVQNSSSPSIYDCPFGPFSPGAGQSMLLTVDTGISSSNFTVGMERTYSATITASSWEDPDPSNNSVLINRSFYVEAGAGGPYCFIATAAYGTYWQPNVVTLRHFRDNWLLTNAPGRAFVSFYYKHSPPIADWIAEREWARAIVRGMLTPLVLSIRYPDETAALLIVLVLAGAKRRRSRCLQEHTRQSQSV